MAPQRDVGRARETAHLSPRRGRPQAGGSRLTGGTGGRGPGQALTPAWAYLGRRRGQGIDHGGQRRGLHPVAHRAARAARRRRSATFRSSCSAGGSSPLLLLCPIGVLDLARRDADLAAARAAAALNVPFIFSNQASVTMEECAREMDRVSAARARAPRWFQLYWSRWTDLVISLVRAGRSVRLFGDRAHAGHDDARLAAAGPGPGLPSVSPRDEAWPSTPVTRSSVPS